MAANDGKIERQSNIELFRILVMISIVAHHLVVNTGLSYELLPEIHSVRNVYFWLLGMWGKIGINCFVLITGYFMCTSRITLKKFLKLLLEVYFYKIFINFGLYFLGLESLSGKKLFYILSPINNVTSNDFTSCFLVFFLVIPFLNILVQNMGRKMHKWLCILMVGVCCVWNQLYWIEVDVGYLLWFPVLYFVASYMRLYGVENQLFAKLMGGGKMSALFWLFLSMLSVVGMLFIMPKTNKELYPYYFVADSNALLALPTSVSLFMCFKNLQIGQHIWINRIAACSFGVLLFHCTGAMKYQLFDVLFKAKDMYSTEHYVLLSLGAVLSVYAMGTVFDMIRIYGFEKPLFKFLDKKGWV